MQRTLPDDRDGAVAADGEGGGPATTALARPGLDAADDIDPPAAPGSYAVTSPRAD